MLLRRCLSRRFCPYHYRLMSTRRTNPLGIQMLSSKLHKQLFSSVGEPKYSEQNIEKSKYHLRQFDLGTSESEKLEDIEFDLPPLENKNLVEHFTIIAQKQSKPYIDLIHRLIKAKIPSQPTQWKYAKGWTKYSTDGQTAISIDYPDEQVMVFDVETLVREGNFPVLAVALSPNHWYSWCSSRLIDKEFRLKSNVELNDMIPMESNPSVPSIIIGHNVAFDRTYIKEQYQLESTAMRFLDTMSLHIMCSGFTHAQRLQYQAFEKSALAKSEENDNLSEQEDFDDQYLSILLASEKDKDVKAYAKLRNVQNLKWKFESSLNNLVSVHKLYCKPKVPLSKEMQQVFVTGNIDDIRKHFLKLMTYCANDVKATFEITQKVYPMFEARFPHPVTLSGMLEMSRMVLPINNNWTRFISEADRTFESINSDIQHVLMQIANEACHQAIDQKYKNDPWLWDLNWTTQSMRFLKSSKAKPSMTKVEETTDNPIFKIAGNIWPTQAMIDDDTDSKIAPSQEIKKVLGTYSTLAKIQPHMPGYPSWYRDLCMKQSKDDITDEESSWKPGPQLISTKMRVVPKLLRLTWLGYPLHYDEKYGWGYLVPGLEINEEDLEEKSDFPYDAIKQVCIETKPFERSQTNMELQVIDDNLNELAKDIEELEGKNDAHLFMENLLQQQEKLIEKRKKLVPSGNVCHIHQGNGPYPVSNVPGCWFFKIPHKDGNEKNVGNPLAKSFATKIADGTLRAHESTAAKWLLEWSKMLSYWENNEKRIKSQMAVQIKDDGTAIILPRVVVSGTVTRRAVEPTWLTASNAQTDRIGSELKAMVQAPSGFCFVGADVDSQELWIASILGDAQFAGMHGSTAFGWMNLQGKKKDGTDLHSKVAALVGISRDQAKVFNYGRMYGAGKAFAEKLLMQFNHQLSASEANTKANFMYSQTKGIKDRKRDLWEGGSESEMFNSLETIARDESPKTPVLNCRISRALEPHNVSDGYMTSRINWVVQSSAVDYLHLMLVCMKWLIDTYDIRCRFVLSIHDEVRYICHVDDRYRACLALQITNLLTRAMFASCLNMNDLPASVAFFSSVDVDQCLRKEPYMDCKTPSNPLGLEVAYDIRKGESLTIADILKVTDGQLQQKNNSTVNTK
ncbi:unnamed protein product [Rotaria magnacalcarata]|uniref:DNA polymerase subunit gamma-1 n=3 Tax=Rotaria magnacalcarata TaxID=392030 RepID=A0A819RGB5_9BILA|nr:unnamed protein product [Rotaria magnacalcarata]CAF4044312.1 unnamed protein product [Rotaria magnacalcarata]